MGKLESIQLWTAPCGCSFHQAHRGDGTDPRFVTLEEAEAIIATRRVHPDYSAFTTNDPQPTPEPCQRHSEHGLGFERFDAVCLETQSHHRHKVE